MKSKMGFVLILFWIGQAFVINLLSLFGLYFGLWLRYVVIITAYLIIVILTWVECKHLEEFNLERLSLITIIIFAFVRRGLGLPNEIFWLIPIWVFGLAIFLVFIINYSKVPRTNLIWSIKGAVAAILVLLPIAIIESLQQNNSMYVSPYDMRYGSVLFAIRQFVYQFAFVSPFEEIIFRGYLWGYLRRFGWKENRILLVQAVLFWFVHLGYIKMYPITFFITIPIITIIFSLLTRYSKQVFPSMIAHTIINAITPIILFFIQT